jgi:uncharacterized repeat protein (TIGR01451 family)
MFREYRLTTHSTFPAIAAIAVLVASACTTDSPFAVRSLSFASASAPTGADIQITGSASTGSPNAGAAFTYTFQVKNNAGLDATDVLFTDTLPAGTGYNFTTASGSVSPCSEATTVVTCTLGTIPKGSQVNVAVGLDAPVIAGSFTNTGRVVSSVADPQIANNAVTVTTQVKTALAPCALPAGEFTSDGLVMFGALDSFSAYENFEYQVQGVNYWVVTNYFDGTRPLTDVINLDCKTSPVQFVQVGNFVNVTGVVDGTIVLPGQTVAMPVLHASVIQVLTHKDAGF